MYKNHPASRRAVAHSLKTMLIGAGLLALCAGVGSASPPEPGLKVDYERAVAVFERVTGDEACPVSTRLSLVFYVPRYQPVAPGGPHSLPLPFVDATYAREDPCANERIDAAGLAAVESEQYTFERLLSASLQNIVVLVPDGNGIEQESFTLTLSWAAVGQSTPVTDPGNDGGHEPGRVVGAEIAGVADGTSITFVPSDMVFSELGSFHRVAGPAPFPGSPRWDPAEDWRDAPESANPSPDTYGNPDVWSYLASTGLTHDASQYEPLPDYMTDREAWTRLGFVNLLVGHAGPFLVMHSYGGGVVGSGRMSVLSWRSPVNGVVRIGGTVSLPDLSICNPAPLGDPGGIVWTIESDAGVIRTFSLPAGGSATFDEALLVHKGDTLNFVHDPGYDSHCDAALLSLSIGRRP